MSSTRPAPGFLTPIFAADPELVAFPHEFFHPYSFRDSWRRGEEFPDAYTVHHWSHLWMTPDESRRRLANKTQRIDALKGRLRAANRGERKATARLAKAEARLAAIERSRWWRLGVRLKRVERRARSGWPKRRSRR